jgi:hypothetical protein
MDSLDSPGARGRQQQGVEEESKAARGPRGAMRAALVAFRFRARLALHCPVGCGVRVRDA